MAQAARKQQSEVQRAPPKLPNELIPEENMTESLRLLWSDEGQDIAEYAVMLAVILIIVIATIRHVGGHANRVFSHVASSIQ